ncbi:Protein of unknown function, putative, partial [Plasmodium vivax]
FSKSLENKHEHENTLNISICRLLARYEQKNELIDTRFKDNLPDRNLHKNRRNVSEHIPTYSSVRSKASNNFDLYMKNYKNRYMRKKGLSKLDCYYENKLFRKLKNMCDIAEKVHNDKKSWKSFFIKKYGIGLIIFALLPTIGLIFPILFGIGNERHGIIPQCPSDHFNVGDNKHKGTDVIAECSTKWILQHSETISKFEYVSYIYMFTMCIIVILFIIYFLIKVIKYEKIKAGKGKMNIKEYCRFCKDIF